LRLDNVKVRRARERVGLSIESAAENAGVAKGSFLRAEHGEEIRPSTARRIAENGLGVRVADLVPDAAELPSKADIPSSLEELLAWAETETHYLTLPDEEYHRLWEGLTTEERATLNKALLEERRRISPWLYTWRGMPAGPDRTRISRMWEFVLARMIIATARNYEAAEAEAEKARVAGDEAQAESALEQAAEFQQAVAA